MFNNPKGLLGLAGLTLALVALYLVLDNAGGATKLITSTAAGWNGILKTLQGR